MSDEKYEYQVIQNRDGDATFMQQKINEYASAGFRVVAGGGAGAGGEYAAYSSAFVIMERRVS